MSKRLSWRTEERKVSDLVPNPRNPRVMSAAQMEALKRSLKKFDLVELPVVDTDNKIVAGHQRLMALQLLGRGDEKIPVRVPSRKLTKQEYEQYLLSSNRISGDWDYELLSQHFDLDTMLAAGFDDSDLSAIFADALEVTDDDFDVDGALKQIKIPKSKIGDLYALGPHRLLCADALDTVAVKKLVGDAQIDMVYCDSPFNISLDYNKGLGGKASYGGDVDDAKTDVEYHAFLRQTLENALEVAKPDCHIFYFCDQKYIGMVQEVFAECNLTNRRVCLWLKGPSNPTPDVAFNKSFEAVPYATRGKPFLSPVSLNFSEVFNKEIAPSGNKLLDDVMDVMDIWLAKRIAGIEYKHPTQKPITLHERPIKRCVKVGGTILDLFGGSGSTLLAADALKRVCFCTEVNPIFIDLIIARYENATGIKSKKLN